MTNSGSFSLRNRDHALKGMASLALRMALHAYFRSYRTMSNVVDILAGSHQYSDDEIDFWHSAEYCEVMASTVIHLHQFIELVCKGILEAEHPLLVFQLSQDHVGLYKAAKGTGYVTDEDKVRSIDFRVALERVSALHKDGLLPAVSPSAIASAAPELGQLAKVRNALVHRGVQILRYPGLDELVIPILSRLSPILGEPEFDQTRKFWKYRKLACGADPLQILIGSDPRDLLRVAFFKELGRAAYENPVGALARGSQWHESERRRLERIAETVAEVNGQREIQTCLVCGLKTLLLYDDVESDSDSPSGGYTKAYRYNWMAECSACTLQLHNHFKNPREYGIDAPDLWMAQDL